MGLVDHHPRDGGHIQVTHGKDAISLVVTKDGYRAAIILSKNEVTDLCIDLLYQSKSI